jgi:hypothetical protein
MFDVETGSQAGVKTAMRDNQGSNTMRGATFSRRDMLWAGGALTLNAAFVPLRPSPAGLVPNRHLGWIRQCPR